MHVLVVGTVALDSIETPFGAVDRALGGSATYIAMAARYVSRPVGVVAVVGGDFPAAYLETLRACDLDLEGVTVEPAGKTFAWGGRYHYDLNDRETCFTHLNVLERFEPVVPVAFREGGVVCLGNLDPGIQAQVLEQVRSPALVLCDTMNFWIEHTPEALRALLRRIDVLIVNDAEARELAGEPNLVKAARVIRDMGPRILVIKKGEHGALLFYDEVVFSAPAYPLEDIQDPTGAGDAFMGGFAGYVARCGRVDEDTLRRAVVFGSAMASFTVERFGPAGLLGLSGEAIARRLEAFRTLAHIPFDPAQVVP
ncbi:sugar kinase [Rhodocaloribacter litoris]|uniref:PfkB family carbohydrate kinase n=1 Tax=Rhodocaloribacter litoris TaxID=2558931 RepID=UPI00141DE0EE|nr:PfkB family carbohydrate kinase [Rhodocaloribacter litoris]QXD15358.1 sugar kinase [Rhodocaloribacter litoris]